MTKFARGGVLPGPDPTPIFTETMLFFAQRGGYVIPASAISQAGARVLAELNDSVAQITSNVTV